MRKIAGWLVAVLAVFFVTATAVYAEEKPADGKDAVQADTTVEGVVAVTKDGDTLKQVTVGEGDQKVCVCFSSEAGRKLADMDGKKVKVVGKLQTKDGKKVIVVTSSEEVKADAAK
ncbi:MAG: hypothetical protein A3K19_16075 [Lentisphaerae bacterium RIFOXYB12_FULL_65_16]|nr:MAG: hypothetical protein A3K18_25825 [Lentisphaerae bacterium RIFOXYA12_64_32]OGV88862.1 MAG: hypothetical protein A3K19_16075 [Lentisphaerae bacterium RIFOXYB12_FULL_65_16]